MTMKAARIFGPNDIRMVDVPVPELGPLDVLCKVKRVGVCGTDYAIYTGEFSFVKNGAIKFPMTPGHEWSGVVAEVGSQVTDFKPGDRVVGDTVVSCGNCNLCLVGDYYRCKELQAVGTINTWDGAYAEYIKMPQRSLFHLPETVSFDQGAFIEPAATSLYSVQRADVTIGDTVLVHGTGPLGLLAGKLAKLSGASKVFITGRKRFKLDLALKYGCDVAIDTTRESVEEIIREHTGGIGVDRVIESSGSIELFKQSFDVVRVDGTISVVAFYEKLADQFDIDKMVFSNVTVRAVAGSLRMYTPVLSLMEQGVLDTSELITGRYEFNSIKQALIDMKEKNEERMKWMVDFE